MYSEFIDHDPAPYPRYGKMVFSTTAEGEWVIEEPFDFQIEPGGRVEVIRPGFTTDLFSIPAPFRVFFRSDGPYKECAVVHDQRYRYRRMSRKAADREFLAGLKARGAGPIRRYLFYVAVRIAWWKAW